MKKAGITFYCFLLSLILLGQNSPRWINDALRESAYPQNAYYSAFVTANAANETVNSMENAVKRKVIESIRVKIRSELITGNEGYGTIESSHEYTKDETQSSAEAEIVGIKVESYKAANVIYAFAYVNRYELIGYYKNNLLVNLGQIESFVKTAQNLKVSGEKAKAQLQLDVARPLFAKVRYAQDLLTAVDPNVSTDDLQQVKIETLYNQLTQMQAQLMQGVYVYVESNENLFGQKVDIVANKVKAELAKNGCSFTGDVEEADFILNISISTREIGKQGSIVFVAADTQIQLHHTHKQKAVYSDEIAQKGSSISPEKAGRMALNNVAPKIAEKLIFWLKN
ncbi:MAG: hypothetical protein LBR65_08970 [Culturomica sp.]|jgi:hypothetical protein|nr:hypothetical protein [Culturomica sp.]